MSVELWEPPFGVDEKHCNEFDEVDPYNPQNTVRGFINRRQGFHYGTLWITHVNDEAVYQVIPSAPKQRYPFDNKGRWDWPECDAVELYEKLDGTCIIGYCYSDIGNEMFTAYKTRLRPFLGEGKFGNFKLLWDEMLVKYPRINELVRRENHFVYVFELFGKRNHHLVRYNTPLDTKMLFARDAGAPYGIWSPWAVNEYFNDLTIHEIPHLMPMQNLEAAEVNEEKYIQIQEGLNERVVQIDMPGTEYEGEATAIGLLEGIEGQVWYFVEDGGSAVQIKCKPERVLDYHWNPERNKQPKIPIHSVYTTIINAFENVDAPDFHYIKELLMEEYPEEMVHRTRPTIERTIANVLFERKLAAEVLIEYKALGVDINVDKGTVMRHMAARFDKRVCGRIFKYLNNYVEED